MNKLNLNLDRDPRFFAELAGNNFTFLGEGVSIKSYVSDDQKTVIKLFNTTDEIIEKCRGFGYDLANVDWTLAVAGDAQATARNLQVRYRESAMRIFTDHREHAALLFAGKIDSGIVFEIDRARRDVGGEFVVVQQKMTTAEDLLKIGEVSPEHYIDGVLSCLKYEWSHGLVHSFINLHSNYGYIDGQLKLIDTNDFVPVGFADKEYLEPIEEMIVENRAWLELQYFASANMFNFRVRSLLKEEKRRLLLAVA